jgi:hypothetical protein
VVNPPFDRFEPSATRWRTANALALAHAAHLAYQNDQSKIFQQLQGWGFPTTGCRVFSVNTAQGLAAANDEMMLVAFRVVNHQDIVPHVPPAFIPFLLIPLHGPIFYRHAGELLHFDATGKLHTDLFLWWRTALRLVGTRRHLERQLRAAPAGFAPLADHSLAAYIQKLQAWLQAGNP